MLTIFTSSRGMSVFESTGTRSIACTTSSPLYLQNTVSYWSEGKPIGNTSANRLRSAENCVLIVQPRGGNSSDEELKEAGSQGQAKKSGKTLSLLDFRLCWGLFWSQWYGWWTNE